MSDTPEALRDALEEQGIVLSALAHEIADEIAQGRAIDMARLDQRRYKIVHLVHRVARLLRRNGAIFAKGHNLDVARTIASYRADVGSWARIDRGMTQHLPPRRCPLEEPPTAEVTTATVRQDAMNRLLDQLHFALKADHGQTDEAYAFGCHDDIPLPASWFFDAVHAAYRVVLAQGLGAGAAFLDVGCGNGMKLLSAKPYFVSCHGLEYQDTSAKAASQLLGKSRLAGCEVFEADGLTFERYGEYRVIYLFRPMRDAEMLCALEDRILAQVAAGTVIIAPYQAFRERSAQVGCGRITEDVFVAGCDQAAADALREEAEFIGLGLRQLRLSMASLWDPIIDAAEARGIALSPFRAERVG